MKVDDILQERGGTHGKYSDNASITFKMWDVIEKSKNFESLNAGKKYGILMILGKIARAVSGDSDHADNYDDIAGYAQLISSECLNEEVDDGSKWV